MLAVAQSVRKVNFFLFYAFLKTPGPDVMRVEKMNLKATLILARV
jgi:hypothetical protein